MSWIHFLRRGNFYSNIEWACSKVLCFHIIFRRHPELMNNFKSLLFRWVSFQMYSSCVYLYQYLYSVELYLCTVYALSMKIPAIQNIFSQILVFFDMHNGNKWAHGRTTSSWCKIIPEVDFRNEQPVTKNAIELEFIVYPSEITRTNRNKFKFKFIRLHENE